MRTGLVSMERPAPFASCVGRPLWCGRCDIRKEPVVMSSVQDRRDLIHVGLDVHARSISVAVLPPGREESSVSLISSDSDAVARWVAGFELPREVFACYEAGPTGYDLAR